MQRYHDVFEEVKAALASIQEQMGITSEQLHLQQKNPISQEHEARFLNLLSEVTIDQLTQGEQMILEILDTLKQLTQENSASIEQLTQFIAHETSVPQGIHDTSVDLIFQSQVFLTEIHELNAWADLIVGVLQRELASIRLMLFFLGSFICLFMAIYLNLFSLFSHISCIIRYYS